MPYKDPKKKLEAQRESDARRKESPRRRAWRLDRVYGKGASEHYERQAVSQNNRCAICRCEQSHKALALDHDHGDGQWRGLLCNRCNLTLGFVENAEWMRIANKYLAEWQDKKRGL